MLLVILITSSAAEVGGSGSRLRESGHKLDVVHLDSTCLPFSSGKFKGVACANNIIILLLCMGAVRSGAEFSDHAHVT